MSDELKALTTRQAVIVTSEEQEAAESANLIVLRKGRKELEKKFDELKKPFKEGLDRLKVEFDAVVDPIKTAERVIGEAILAWKAAERRRIAHEQAERDRQQRELERQAAEKRQPPPAPLAPVQDQAKGWATERGTMTTRRIPKWRIIDEQQVPLEMDIDGERVRLWEIVGAAITKVRAKCGEKPSPIPGVEFYYDEGLNIR